MDSGDFDDFGEFGYKPQKRPDHVKVKRGGSFFSGHHTAKFEVPVPDGKDPREFADQISTKIGSSPAPLSPVNVPTETPTPTRTIGMPSLVSKASSEDRTDHNVMVEAMPNHILSGKNGTAAGINYHTYPHQKKDGTQVVVTEKESYGDSRGVLGPLRYLVGTFGLNPHLKRGMNDVYDSATKKEDGQK